MERILDTNKKVEKQKKTPRKVRDLSILKGLPKKNMIQTNGDKFYQINAGY